MRLTEPSHWDTVHEGRDSAVSPQRGSLRQRLSHLGRNYSSEQLWDVVLPKHLVSGPLRALEIGSAPGFLLKGLHDRYGYQPYGVEYSPVGAQTNRTNFKAWGFPPEHVFESDALAPEFHRTHGGTFDVVMSCGFIEHFTDLQPVMDAHLNLLKPGGTLIITVPNYRGLNYALGLLTVRNLYPLHNLELMRIETFRKLFSRPDLETRACEYVGGFDLGLLDGGIETGFSRLVLKVARRTQWFLNVLFRSLFFGHVPESRYTSPYLLYVGSKTAA